MDAETLRDLPGAELVLPGLQDAREGRETVESLLVAIAAGHLRDLGLDVPPLAWPDAELRLYARLCEAHGPEAHGRYLSLLRRLVSFQRAADGRARRDRSAGRRT